jgi:mannosyltransferase
MTADTRRPFINVLTYSVISILMVYAHYFGFVVLFVQFIHLLLFNRTNAKPVSLSWCIVAVCYVPQLWFLSSRVRDSVSRGTWVEKPEGLDALYNMIWAFSNAPVSAVVCISILFLSIVFVRKIEIPSGRERLTLQLMTLWFLVPYIGMFIVSYHVPVFISRYLVFALPGFCGLIAWICCRWTAVKKNRIISAGLIILLFLLTTGLNPPKHRPLRAVASIMEQAKDGHTTVVINPPFLVAEYAYHLDRRAFTCVDSPIEYRSMDSVLRINGVIRTGNADELRAAMPLRNTVLYVTTGEKRNTEEDPVWLRLSSLYNLRWIRSAGYSWKVSFFERHPK